MENWTPGKWIKDRNMIEDENGKIIAEVSYKQDGYVQANARLIAACPELLETCKALISNAVWDGKTREHGSANEYTIHRAVIEATQRAIAKAEGRE